MFGANVSDRVSVSAICTSRQSLQEDLSFWDRHGIDRVGIAYRKLGRGDAQRIADQGLRVTSLLGLGTELDKRETWQLFRTEIQQMFEDALTMKAEYVVLTSGSAGELPWEIAGERLAELLSVIAEDSGGVFPVPLLLEHTNQLRFDISFVHTLHDAIDLVRTLGLGVVMEINACWLERALSSTIASGMDVISLVQVSDTKRGVRCTPERAVPGDGVIPIARILGDLMKASYKGAFELEFVGESIESEGYEKAVPRALEVFKRLLADASFGSQI